MNAVVGYVLSYLQLVYDIVDSVTKQITATWAVSIFCERTRTRSEIRCKVLRKRGSIGLIYTNRLIARNPIHNVPSLTVRVKTVGRRE